MCVKQDNYGTVPNPLPGKVVELHNGELFSFDVPDGASSKITVNKIGPATGSEVLQAGTSGKTATLIAKTNLPGMTSYTYKFHNR